jgi:hypothetical protein
MLKATVIAVFAAVAAAQYGPRPYGYGPPRPVPYAVAGPVPYAVAGPVPYAVAPAPVVVEEPIARYCRDLNINSRNLPA